MNEVAQERAETIVSEDKFQGGDQTFGENLLITNSRIVSYDEITLNLKYVSFHIWYWAYWHIYNQTYL